MEGAKELLEKAGFESLPDNWDAVQIKDLISNERGLSVGVMYPGEHTPGGVPLIRSGDLNGSIINDTPTLKISTEKHIEYRRTELEGGEIIMSLVGTVGQCAVVPQSMAGWNTARAVAVMRLKDASDAAYVRAALLSPPLQRLMLAWSNTTVQTTLNLKEIKQLPIPWPPREDRHSIAQVLSCIDDKISLNRRINKTLEQLAQTLFGQWFVNFDFPNTESQPYRNNGGELVDSKLGEIPKGWNVGIISDLFTLQRGFDLPSTNREEGSYPIFAASGYAGTHKKYMVKGPGITTGRSGVIGNVYLVHEDYWPLNTSLWVKEIKASALHHAYFILKGINLKEMNAGSAVPTLNRNHVHSLHTIIPHKQVIAKFEKVVGPLFKNIRANEVQSSTLATLRDTLLLQLLTGRLTVKQAEELAV